MRSKPTILLTTLGVVLLAGCATPAPKQGQNSDILTADTILKPTAPLTSEDKISGLSIKPETKSDRPPPAPEIQVGTAQFFKQQPPRHAAGGEGQVTFNFENQPIQAVVKAILGDMLQENYTIAPNVGGNVTYSTSRPIRREDALPVLEMLLSWTGNALVREGNRYTVLQSKDAIPGKLTPAVGASQQPGYGLRIFPLKYISASETAKLLKPYAKPDAIVQIDPNRSLIVLAGTPSELDNYQRTIDTFDIDWMKGMSIGVYAMQHVEVAKLMPDLQKIFGTEGESPLAGMFRFMPIEQTNSMIVITPQPAYLRQAEDWLRRLDQGGKENTVQLYVYNVKNLKAPDLADYLSQIFLGTSSGTRSSTSGRVGQGLRSTTLGSRGGSGGMNNMSYQNSLRPQSNQEKSAPATPAAAPAPASGGGGKDTDIRISAIEENNQLMIQATPFEWDQIESAIKRLDVVPLQVQIEARILEVSMTGNLNLGVQWYLNGMMGTATGSAQENGRYPLEFSGNRWDRHRSTLGATGNVAPPNNGGFFYSFLSKKFEVAINAMEKTGQAKSLAAPSLMVMNNQEAQINVGQQIPVVQNYVTGIGIGTNSSGNTITPGYGSVQYLNTGVMLSVKPRVNPGGLIYLDVQQEVSNPPAGYSSSTGTNPAIAQRQIQTQVAIQSGETLLLGGLIQDNRDDGSTGVPFISRIPGLRNLFGNTTQSTARTELIVLLTPRVIASVDEARQATQEYVRQFQSLTPLRSSAPPAAATRPDPGQPQPVQTYPVQEPAKPQEEPLRDH
ncbi:type II secretion system secretin GspD [Dokdonella sp.]|uniref:type II secretion system secretin GspD n=1 Tax=Dokdonella sp. TaxID=2291710 RepID=UPI00261FCCF4|nr:type II secretion system secretin GspD [Dokdonella sp.]